jgi:glycosyltransferase involved in cell wall biosynthesis
MADKIRVLFHCVDQAGVNYYRMLTPATELERNHSDKFYVEINQQIDFNDPNIMDYLKSFNIIHYHRQLVPETNKMIQIAKELKSAGVKLVMDIDDYWELHPKHPLYALSKERKMHVPIIENLKIADYITTTTELFAEKIKEITLKDNVGVFYNAVNPTWMKQFQDNHKPDPNGLVRIGYVAGSSHMADIQQLEGVVNMLRTNHQTRDKFRIVLGGWDSEGSTTEISFNEEFGKILKERGLWNQSIVKQINKWKGDIDKIEGLPLDLIDKYRGNVFIENKRDIRSEESIYYTYEKILTDNHKIINDNDYYNWLMNFERNLTYPNEGQFARRWTQKANIYAKTLDETDIVLAPLHNNEFNTKKSNLKQVECWSRKLPIVCSDMAPYNVDGKHMENCVLIPNKHNIHKEWFKYLKKLILDSDLRKQLGEGLYNDFKEKYHLTNVTQKRAEFYEKITENNK